MPNVRGERGADRRRLGALVLDCGDRAGKRPPVAATDALG
jgi:hypothetical protein